MGTPPEQPYQPAPTPFQLEPAPAKSPKKWLIPLAVLAVLLGGYLAVAKSQSLWPFTPSATPSPSPSALTMPATGWKTYHDPRGFEFSYAASYYLDAAVVTTATNAIENPEDVRKLNEGLPENAPFLAVTVTQFSRWSDSCTKADLDYPLCTPTKADISSDIAAIAAAPVGAELKLRYISGKVVQTPAGKGILAVIGPSPQTSPQWNWSVDFMIYAADRSQIHFYTDTTIYGQKAGSQVLTSPEYADMQHVASTFKFTSSATGWETYTNMQYGLAFQYPSGEIVTTFAPVPDGDYQEIIAVSIEGGSLLVAHGKPSDDRYQNHPAPTSITVDGVSAQRSTFQSKRLGCNGILVEVPSRSLIIAYDDCYPGSKPAGFPTLQQIQAFNAVLATFKFTK